MARRGLSPDEREVWSRVARSVRALDRAAKADDFNQEVAPAPSAQHRGAVKVANARTLPVVATLPKPTPRASANTLDGGWDKRLEKGSVVPERTIDLHGCSLDQAHARLERGLALAIADGVRVLLLVTGKAPHRDVSRLDLPLRGIIRASVGDWIAASRHTRHIAAVRSAHPRHGGAGAVYVILRRAR